MATREAELLKRSIGGEVRRRREELGYSLELLAGLADISKSGLLALESGAQMPRLDKMIRIAFALGARLEDLVPDRYEDFFRSPLSGLNANARGTRTRGGADQARKTSKRRSREGGFSTTPARPAETLPEVA